MKWLTNQVALSKRTVQYEVSPHRSGATGPRDLISLSSYHSRQHLHETFTVASMTMPWRAHIINAIRILESSCPLQAILRVWKKEQWNFKNGLLVRKRG